MEANTSSKEISEITPPSHPKRVRPDRAILDGLAQRWSPYAFDGNTVSPGDLMRCLEAARWAPSSYNEQPWSFVIATREDRAAFDKMLGVLVEPNRAWARHAGAVLLAAIRRTHAKNGKPNRLAEHDLGLAMGNFGAQATALGLHVHQMAGILLEEARAQYSIPEGYDPMTAIAVGRALDPDTFAQTYPDGAGFADRDRASRTRKSLGEFVFEGRFGDRSPLLDSQP